MKTIATVSAVILFVIIFFGLVLTSQDGEWTCDDWNQPTEQRACIILTETAAAPQALPTPP